MHLKLQGPLMADSPDRSAISLFEKVIYLSRIINKDSTMVLCFFIVEFGQGFSRSSPDTNWDSNFLINTMLQLMADFFIILFAPVAFIKKEERLIYGILFNLWCILKINRGNASADISIKSVVTGKNCDST